MPIGKDYRLTIGSGREALPPADDREGAASADLSPEPAVVFEALKLTPGADEIIKEIRLARPTIHIQREGEGWSFSRLLKRQEQEADRSGPARPATLRALRMC